MIVVINVVRLVMFVAGDLELNAFSLVKECSLFSVPKILKNVFSCRARVWMDIHA